MSTGHCLRAALLALLAATAALPPAQASVYRIDETGTFVSQPVVQMRWRHFVPRRGGDNTVEATVRVDVRLNVQTWLNKPARIYMVLAPMAGDRVAAHWTTQGRLLAGQVRSGGRALVYEGTVGPAVMEDALTLTIEADGDRLDSTQLLDFHFEIEVTP